MISLVPRRSRCQMEVGCAMIPVCTGVFEGIDETRERVLCAHDCVRCSGRAGGDGGYVFKLFKEKSSYHQRTKRKRFVDDRGRFVFLDRRTSVRLIIE